MIYNDKNNLTRLVFIDEPFAKMDPVNVKIMLGFMKEQKLQKLETLIREYENRSPICYEECGKLCERMPKL